MPTALARVRTRLSGCGALVVLCLLVATCDQPVGPTATNVTFTGEPTTATAGTSIAPAVRVEARDASGRLVSSFTGSVTVAIKTNAGGGTLSGDKTVAAVGGVATFSDLSIEKTGSGYTLLATANGLAEGTSAPFTITPGPATKLAFTLPPTATTAGAAITPAVQVTAQDAYANTVPSMVGDVTVAIAAGTGTTDAKLAGPTTVVAVAGVATFSGLSIDKSGNDYRLAVTTTDLAGDTSGIFAINAGTAAQLDFTRQPDSTVAGAPITPAPQVTVRDALRNPVKTFNGDVTLAIAVNPGGGTLTGTLTVAASAGVATFNNVSIDRAAVGYRLEATATGVSTRDTSNAFKIKPSSATRLEFTVQPAAATAGATIAPAVRVTARDALGNTATGFTGIVTLAIASNPAGGILSGTAVAAADGGVATFSSLRIDKAGSGYTLAATAAGLTGATSAGFTIGAGGATRLAFTVQPTTVTAGVTFTPAVQVTAQDSLGNTVPSFTGNVTVALGTNPAGGTLSGTTTVAAVVGVATFPTLSINHVANVYTFAATAPGLTGATSAPFAIGAGPASQLAFTVQPSIATAGAAISPAVQVAARDALGNPVSNFAGNVTLTITTGTGPGGANLSGTKTMGAVAGVATFSNLSINKSGTGYTLSATASGLNVGTSAPFAITAGAATQLVFTVQPAPTTTAGVPITPAVQVTARDAFENTADGFTGSVTVAIAAGTGTSDAKLAGTTTVAALAGVATFSSLSIDKSGNDYRLAATATGLAATSAIFAVNVGAPAQLDFTLHPVSTVAGAPITPAVQVTVRDALGNPERTFTGNVTLAIGANPGGGTLSGTLTVVAVAGVATFSDLSINRTGVGYELEATGSGLSAATSNAFSITAGPASQLAFMVQPGTVTAGAPITPAPKVTAQDALGNTVTTFTANVTVALGTNPTGGTLSGTTTVVAVAGVATFSTLSINRSGSGYTLSATATGVTAIASVAFNIGSGATSQLAFTVQPSTATAGAAISPAVQVAARDALGNPVSNFAGNVTLTITTGTGPGGANLSGTKTMGAVAGVATFSNLSINKSGTGYTLSATASGLASATSTPFAITAGAATQLAFTVQPTTTTAGLPITPAVQVTARDALGNTADGFTGSVTVAISAGTGTTGARLAGDTTVAAVAGVATFSTLSVDKSGNGYQLEATATSLAPDTSSAFRINVGAPAKLEFSLHPATAVAGVAITPAVQVTARDAFRNPVSTFTGDVTMAIETNPGGGTLSGTLTVAAVAGVATFSDLSINRSGVGYRLEATASGLSADTSNAFAITAGLATQFSFTVPPSDALAGAAIAPAVQVAAQDALGNTVTTFTSNVIMALATNPASGTLGGTTTVAAVGGVATFSTLSINRVGSGYTLQAAGAGLTAPSASFTIAPAAAAGLAFTVPPSDAVAGVTMAPAVQVTARDAFGNTATGFAGDVTVALGAGTTGGTLSGTLTVPAASGVATFADLSIDRASTGHTLTAGAAGVASATSTGFDITAAAGTRLVFSQQPSNATAGAAIAPAVRVTAQDGFGNTVTGFTGDVTVALAANPAGGTLSGTLTAAPVNGVATFANLSINVAGTGYALSATAAGLTVTSDAFAISVGAPARLDFTLHPSLTVAGAPIAPAVQVTVRDAQGNTASGFTDNVTLAIATNPGGGTLSGTRTVAAVAGVATFSDLSINRTGVGYQLRATGSGLSADTSSAFTITAGPASQLAFTVEPRTTSAGAAISPAVEVAAQDALGNTVPSFTESVTVALGTNPTGGTLSGTTMVAAVAGVATFSTLSIDSSGTGYTLAASATGVAAATSVTFDINSGATSQLVFTVQPSTATAGATISPAVQVAARDALGNSVSTYTGSVTLRITAGTDTSGAMLSGTRTVAAVAGVATFSTLNIDKSGTGYTLSATASGLASATSTSFAITAGAATQLAFTEQPATTTAGAPITPAVRVAALDALDNVADSFTGSVTVAIAAGTGTTDATLAGTKTATAVAGVATFSDLSIDKSGNGYRLEATATNLAPDTSSAFRINVGAPAKLEFSLHPATAVAGVAITPAVQVTARDAFRNPVSTFTGHVTVVIQTNPGGGMLSGTLTVAAVAGVATFSDLSINRSGEGYRLEATASGLSSDTSNAFSINAGQATQFTFTVPPSDALAGAALAPAVQVAAQDALGNTVTTFTGNVIMTIGTNPPPGGTLSGTDTVAAVRGVATFADLSIDRAGAGYTLQAVGAGLTGQSAVFAIAPAAAAAIAISAGDGQTATVGTAVATPPAVVVRDQFNNPVAGVEVTFAVASGGGTVSPTTPVTTNANGIAAVTSWTLGSTAGAHTLTATSGTLTGSPVTFSATGIAGNPTRLAFTVEPVTTTAGATISPAVQVTAQDALGNTATSFRGNVTLAIGTNPSGGTLSGTRTVAAIAGVATFSTLSIDKTGAGYVLSAAATGLTATASASFEITAGAPSQLAFTVPPSNTVAGAAIAPAVQVTVQDALLNTVPSFAGSVMVEITPGTGAVDARLSGTTTVSATAGVATFSTLSIDRSGSAQTGTGYTLSATAAGLLGTTSDVFNILTGPASKLAFTVEPSNAVAGAAIAPAVQVTAQDASGNRVTTFVGNVTVAIENNPVGGVLSGTTTVAAVAGVASFSTLSIDTVATGYTLVATASGLSSDTSAAFNITPGPAAALVFTVQPLPTTTAGAILTPAVRVTARDAFGNTATGFMDNVTVAIASNPAGGTLSGTRTVAAVAGVATFSTLNIDVAGAGYALSATSNGLAAATSTAFEIIPSAATRIAFVGQPSPTTAGAPITPAVRVAIHDASGNIVMGFEGNVTIAIGDNPAGGTLSGTTTVAAVAGVASFGDLSINKAAVNPYTLAATSNGFAATSDAFTITPDIATALRFTVQPSTAAAGDTITPQVEVTAYDAHDNIATGFAGNVTIAIASNPAGGTLSGTTAIAAVNGVATFSTLRINTAGIDYTISAASGSLTPDTSTPFEITAGAASRLAFTVQPPAATTAGATLSPALEVTARDSLGNPVTTFVGRVSLTITGNTSGATLAGTREVDAVAGVATFGDLRINQVGTDYRLSATATGLAGTTSDPFTINPGAASQLAFTVQPTTTTAGAPITPAVQVTARDAHGNIATDFTGGVTVALGPHPNGGTLSGTTTVTALAGVASFSDLRIAVAASGYTLAATATGVNGDTSAAFTITANVATTLQFTVQPSTAAAGAAITPQVEVTAHDANGNIATDFTGSVTIALEPHLAGGTLTGTASVAAVAGVASFGDLRIDKAAQGYRLTATATGLAGTTSAFFDITAGTATQLVFTGQPTAATSNATLTPVRVTARDAFGNAATGFAGNVTVAIGNNPAGGTLSGTRTFAAIGGVATFSTLRIDKEGQGYTLAATATAAGLVGATSAAFDIIASTATQLFFTVQPGGTTDTATADAAITPPVQVTARDASGQTVTSFAGDVTVAIGVNPGGGTLSGMLTVAAVGGVATFSDLSIDKTGAGYKLTATAAGLQTVESAFFTVKPGPAAQLAFTVQPSTATALALITPQVEVMVRDALGNRVTTFTGNVTVAITAGTGTAGATLSGTTTVAAAQGIASFATLSIDSAGTAYQLTATADGMPEATSAPFNITSTLATQLEFMVRPTSTIAGVAISPAVQVRARDASGQTDVSFTRDMTLSITANTGTSGARLSGTTTVAAINGVATFSTLSIDRSGTGYKLSATATGVAGRTSLPFTIDPGAATQLSFTVQPDSTPAGAPITPAVQVTVKDAFGNPVKSFNGTVTVAIQTNAGGGTLSGTTTVTASQGVATFYDLSIDKAGTGYRLEATSSGLTSGLSDLFSITAGAATRLVFSVQPSNVAAGAFISPNVRVTALDAFDNVARSFTGSVTIAIGNNPAGGTLAGTTDVTPGSGVAIFSDLSINLVGTGYTLTVTAGLLGVTSTAFNVF